MENPASSIISRCGGASAVAGWLKLNQSSVLRWTYPRERGGTGGLVPSKHQRPLIEAAASRGVNITPADFFPRPPQLELAQAASRRSPKEKAA